ncbi:MarR family transcriptional regulator [Streptomyces sp. WMMC500]|uniref:MarR family transcriptional regulator n=1 Tax=Streptomyces sp. WMMC500 TaxID=3015154 RepID=UPI00248AB34C|nr:MarR family transcriptional regulator [Streptomyces sp. WMMC500]WBB59778.1 MarR family transcriptional regulator [Streptomyces sp. WMMC500]
MHEPEEIRTANLLGAAALAVADRMTAAAAAASGVGVSGTAALVTLRGAEGIGVTELGRRIGLSQPACARMVDQLVGRGLVERERGGGRGVALRLTEAGAAAAVRAQAARRDGLRRVLAALPAQQAAGLTEALELLLTEVYGDVGSEDVLCRLCDRGACLAGEHLCPVGQAARAGQGGRGG